MVDGLSCCRELVVPPGASFAVLCGDPVPPPGAGEPVGGARCGRHGLFAFLYRSLACFPADVLAFDMATMAEEARCRFAPKKD